MRVLCFSASCGLQIEGGKITTDSCGLYFGHQSFNSDYSNEVSIRGHAERCSAVIMPAELLLQIGVTQL